MAAVVVVAAPKTEEELDFAPKAEVGVDAGTVEGVAAALAPPNMEPLVEDSAAAGSEEAEGV